MAKFSGKIGYGITSENPKQPGVWIEKFIEKPVYGDVKKLSRRFESSNNANGEIKMSTTLSIIADPFAIANFQYIKYVMYLGTKWTISDADVSYPRLNLTLGGVYNGE